MNQAHFLMQFCLGIIFLFGVGCSTQSSSKEEALLALGDTSIVTEPDDEGFNEELTEVELESDEAATEVEVAQSSDSFDDFDAEGSGDDFAEENLAGVDEGGSEESFLLTDNVSPNEDEFAEFSFDESSDVEETLDAGFEELEESSEFSEVEIEDKGDDQSDFFTAEESGFEAETSIPALADSDSVSGPKNTIQNVEYFANPNGGIIAITGSSQLQHSSRFDESKGQLVIELEGVNLPISLQRPYLLKDFQRSSFSSINAYQRPGSSQAQIVVQLRDPAKRPQLKIEGNQLLLLPLASDSLEPTKMAQTNGNTGESQDLNSETKILGAQNLNQFLRGNTKFYGKPISIQVKDADVREVLNFIADESGANLVVSDDVQGKVSIKLRQVPWDQALVTLLRANQLGYIRSGNVIQVSKIDRLKAESEVSASLQTSQSAQAPLKVKVIPVSFANVEQIKKQITPLLTKERGSVVEDLRTNSLVVTDTAEIIDRAVVLVRELDIAPAQVLIEGKVVEAGEDFVSSAGINWGFGGGIAESGSTILQPSFVQSPMDQLTLQAKTTTLNLRMGTFDIFGDLTASLALAERDSMVKIISSPRIVAMNKEKAIIKTQGQNITIATVIDVTGLRTVTAQRDPIEVSLEVTPQVTNDGNVIMDLKVLRQFAGALVNEETQARAINSRQAETKILVRNGQTAVIGGIYQTDETSTEIGTPFLKDIPVLGWLFKEKRKDMLKNELLIFVTPRILNNQNEQSVATTGFLEE